MSLYDEQLNIGSMEHDEFVYREENLKQTIRDFTEEFKEEVDKIDNAKTYDKGNGIVSAKFVKEAIDKLNQKHYGDKLIKKENKK